MIIHDGIIEEMQGPARTSDRSSVPAIDLKGRTVIPGLFNTHCHIQMVTPAIVADAVGGLTARLFHQRQVHFNMAECIRRGVTSIRDTATEDLDGNRRLDEAIGRGTMPGPRIHQAVYVGMLGSSWSPNRTLKNRLFHLAAGLPYVDFNAANSGIVTFAPGGDRQQVRDAVDRAIDERGARFLKVYEEPAHLVTYQPGAPLMEGWQLDALADRARARGVPVTMHHGTVEAFRRGVKAGVTSLAHLPFDQPLNQEDIRAFLDSGCIIEPTVSMAWDLCWKLEGDDAGVPRLAQMDEFRRGLVDDLVDEFWVRGLCDAVKSGLQRVSSGRTMSFGILDMAAPFRYFSAIITHGVDNFNALFDSGAVMACGNDGGVPPCTVPMVGHELRVMDFFLRHGRESQRLTGRQALQIATGNSALAMGLDGQAGTLAAGGVADLVILDGDPLQDFGLLGSPAAAVFREGRLVSNPAGLAVSSRI